LSYKQLECVRSKMIILFNLDLLINKFSESSQSIFSC